MIQAFPIIAGIFASLLHVISGPDHLAAVTPLVFEKERSAWKIGLFWGLGHLSGMLLIGLLFILLKDNIPIESISEHSEKLVGFVLIGIGFWTFYRIYKRKSKHRHPHIHLDENTYVHIHKHGHNHSHEHNHNHKEGVSQNILSSYSIGFLHGLAGIAHFVLLLPVLGFTSNYQGVQYVIGFGIGTIVAMVLYASILGKISQTFKKSNNKLVISGIQVAGGIFAIIIGLYWIFFLS